ncbi:iron-siderophore ABC transporter substrate-binding protein [Marinobacter sp.]|uniref:ABC transporter substrate-binding protein n=1 Tax=Marinobacter sp. TaxID=50741 RepID=UPI0023525195|nr:iron-siderophore ABC transporter substrate-binding protein [Marinobacter sp.]
MTIKHALGVSRISGSPDRVVSLYQGATDTAVALGIEPVGAVESWTEKPFYRYLRSALPDVRMLGLETQPDLEGIAWLNPDLIVAASNRHLAIYPLLQQIAPTVVINDVYDFKTLLTLMAKATGKEQLGQCLLRHWQARAGDFHSRIRGKLGEAWPQEVAILSFRADHARIYYGGFARSVLDELGFSTPSAHRREGWGIKLTSQESIPAMDAEAIFLFMQDDPAVRRTFNRWTDHPLWQNLEAVRAGEVYPVNPVTWNMGAGILAANLMLDDLYKHYGLANTLPEAEVAC